MNIMRVQEIKRVNHNRLEYSYTIEGEWKKYFEPSNPMWVEYSQPVDQVPDSITVLPLIGNVIVLASLMDADIYVDEIDRDFYECIEEFIEGFDSIMPDHVHFKHRDIVHANKIVDTPLSPTEQEENLLFFSGGVDATFSLITHLEEKPALVTIWGADIPWDNEDSWKQAIAFNQRIANHHQVKLIPIHSNFRTSFHADNINDYSVNLVGNWWWPAFQHGIAMMCLTAPVICGKRKKLYLASSFTSDDLKKLGSIATASAPQIDNHVRLCGCQVVHDANAYSRYNKITHICRFYEHDEFKPFLRVCYHSKEGGNCGVCEKCVRDIMSILVAGYDPELYGFRYHKEKIAQNFAAGLQEMARTEKVACISFYQELQAAYRAKCSIEQVPLVLRAFYEVDLETLTDFLHVPNNECIAKDKILKEVQAKLYDEIGQLRYQAQVERQAYENERNQIARDPTCADAEKQALLHERDCLLDEKRALEAQLQKMYQSTSWKVTKPLRYAGELRKKSKAKPKDALTEEEKNYSGIK